MMPRALLVGRSSPAATNEESRNREGISLGPGAAAVVVVVVEREAANKRSPAIL
jgi:hypothetical protein